jgi:hypothetical protein
VLVAGSLFVVVFVLVVALIVVTLVRAGATVRAAAEWPTVQGEIVAIQRRTSMTPNLGASSAAGLPAGSVMTPTTSARAIVRYTDSGGQVHEGRARRGRDVGRLGVGQLVVVACDPQLPSRAVIRGVLAR